MALGYTKRLPFAKASGLSHDRTLSDLENERRTNFDAATIAQVEQVYRWESGSVRAILDGGEPTELSGEIVVPEDHDGGVLLDMPPEVLEGLTPAERDEVITAAKLSALQTAREIRRRLDG